MRNDLVPEQRVDKNGRVTTRHVRNGRTPPPSTLTKLSNPPSIPQIFALKADMGVFGIRNRFGVVSEQTSHKITEMLRRLEPETLLSLRDAIVEMDEPAQKMMQQLIEDRSAISHITPATMIETDLHYAALIFPLLTKVRSDTSPYDTREWSRELVGSFDGEVTGQILHASEDAQDIVRGTVVMGHMNMSFDEGDAQTTRSTYLWVGQNAEAILDNADALNERGTFDRNLFDRIINHQTPAIRDGIL